MSLPDMDTFNADAAEFKEMVDTVEMAIEVCGPDVERLVDKAAPIFNKLLSKMAFQGHTLNSLTEINIATEFAKEFIKAGTFQRDTAMITQVALQMAHRIVTGVQG